MSFDSTVSQAALSIDALAWSAARACLRRRRRAARARSHRLRAVSWRAKRATLQLWLVQKLASLASEPNELISQFKILHEKECMEEEARIEAVQHDDASAEFVEKWERVESQIKRTHQDIEIALRWLHREARIEGHTDDGNVGQVVPVRKRELFSTLCEARRSNWAIQLPQGMALRPILQQHDFAMTFLLSPVVQPGYISEEEFVILGLLIAEIEPKFQQVKQNLASRRAASGTRRWAHWSSNTDATGMCDDIQDDESRVTTVQLSGMATLEDPGHWARAHTHITVRLNGMPPYCCLCRRNRTNINIKMMLDGETEWTEKWQTTRECRLDALVPEIRHEVDMRRRSARLEEARRTQVSLVLRALVDVVSANEEQKVIISAILRAAVLFVDDPGMTYADYANSEHQKYLGGKVPSVAQLKKVTVAKISNMNTPVRIVVCTFENDSDSDHHILAQATLPQDNLMHPPVMPLTLELDQGATLTVRLKQGKDANQTPQLCILSAKGLRRPSLHASHQSQEHCQEPLDKNIRTGGGGNTMSVRTITSDMLAPAAISACFDGSAPAPTDTDLSDPSQASRREGVEMITYVLNPYCIIYLQDIEIGRTRTASMTCNPVWTEENNEGQWVILKRTEAKKSTLALKKLMLDAAKRLKMEATLTMQISRQLDARDVDLIHVARLRSCALNAAERERSIMATEECHARNIMEVTLRKLEAPILFEQEEAQQSLHMLVGELTEKGAAPFLTRLTWIESIVLTGGPASPTAHVVRDPASGKTLFLRFLPLQYTSDAKHAASAAEDLRDLRCCGVVQVLSVRSHKVTSFNLQGTCSQMWILLAFVTSYVGSHNIVDKINCCRDTIGADTIQIWAYQIAVALTTLHHGGLLHQNIHPRAICLDDHGHAVLDDFLFLSDARPRHCNYSRGRSDYGAIAQELIAPEISHNSGAVSPKADVWAFGCCLYHWVTGTLPPVQSEHILSLLQTIPKQFSGSIYHAIGLALQPHPPTRATADDLVRILANHRLPC